MSFKIGDRVLIITNKYGRLGQAGIIVGIAPNMNFNIRLKLSDVNDYPSHSDELINLTKLEVFNELGS